jgi:membrane protease YdiL (CAAX protease family)
LTGGPDGGDRPPDDHDTSVEGPAGVFSLEGRAVPAVYVIGWLGTLLGGGILFVSFAATSSGAATWLFLVGLAFLAVGLVAATGSQAIDRARRPDLAYRGPSPILAFLVVVVLTLLVLIVILAPLSAVGLDPTSPLATTLNLAITTALYVGVIRFLVVGPGSLSWSEMGVVRPTAGAVRDLAAGALLALPVLVVTLALGAILARFLEPSPSPLPGAVDAAGVVANLLSAAILAPIGEELFFRGFATTAWARAAGPAAAILRGAVFFALAHVVTLVDASFGTGVQRALFSFLALLPVGLALGWLYLGRRSLYAAIGLHAAFNAIQVLLLALGTS